jgi:hypothetical protein
LEKRAHAAEQERPAILKRRRDWFESQPDLDPQRLGLNQHGSALRSQ